MDYLEAAKTLRELHYFYPNRAKAEAIEMAVRTLERTEEIERVYAAPVVTLVRALAEYMDRDN